MYFLIFFFFSVGLIHTSGKRTVSIVFSYEPDATGEKTQDHGIVNGFISEGFMESHNLEIKRYWMNTKTINNTPEKKILIADQIRRNLTIDKPECIMALDDDAFRYVGLHNDTNENVVFAGVNVLPEVLNSTVKYFFNSRENPGLNTTGIYEKNFLGTALKVWRLAIVDFTKVLLIVDVTVSGNAIKEQLIFELEEVQEDIKDIETEIIQIQYLEEFKDIIINRVNNEDEDISAIYTMGLTLTGESDGKVYKMHNYIVEWMLKNSKKVEFCNQPKFSSLGLFGGAGLDFEGMGFSTGKKCGKILNQHLLAGSIPMDFNPRNLIFYNSDRVKQLQSYGVQFNDEVLSNLKDICDYVYYEIPEKEVDVTSYILMIIGISFALFGTFVFCGFLTGLFIYAYKVRALNHQKKIRKLTTFVEMILTLDLENEFIKKIRNQTKFSQIEKILMKIIDNLKLYTPFLPLSIFAEDFKGKENIEFKTKIVKRGVDFSSVFSTPPSNPRKKYDKYKNQSKIELSPLILGGDDSETNDSPKSDVDSDVSNSSDIFSPIQKRNMKLQIGLAERIITMMVIELVNFNSLLSTFIIKDISDFLKEYVEMIAKCVQMNGGTIHFILGSVVYCSWNSASRCVSHSKQACLSATLIQERMKQMNERWKKEKGFPSLLLRMVLSRGESCFGNIGCSIISVFNFVGKLMKESCKLIEYAKDQENNELSSLEHDVILINEEVFNNVKFLFICRLIDELKDVGYVYNIEKKKSKVECDEWLYEIKEHLVGKNNLLYIYNESKMLYLSACAKNDNKEENAKKLQEARKNILKCIDNDKNDCIYSKELLRKINLRMGKL